MTEMDVKQTVWVTRHGNRADFVDPEWPRTASRPYDPPLSADGVVQAKELAGRLVGEGIRHIFASPFLRTVQTAAEVAETLDLPLCVEDGLGEMLNPEWFPVRPEVMSPAQRAAAFPRVDVTYRSRVSPTYPETWDELMARSERTARLLCGQYEGALLLVAHGGSAIGVCQGLLGDPDRKVDWPLCGLTKLVREAAGWRMVFTGDTSHLSQPDAGRRLA